MNYLNSVKHLCSAPSGKSHGQLLPILSSFGNPQKRMKYLLLAGSNGKTVCGEMLVSVLTLAGYRVGYLRMPAREEPKENICLGKKAISDAEFAEYMSQLKLAQKSLSQGSEPLVLTREELLLGTAMLAFQANKCDLCMIESNHFGEDPSHALPPPFAAVICGTIPNGDASEVAKIRSYICRGIEEIVSAPQDNDAFKIISDTCYSANCRLTLPMRNSVEVTKLSLNGTRFNYKNKPYSLKMCGRFQVYNAILAIEVIEMLSRRGFTVSEEALVGGLYDLKIPAKFELISFNPLIIVDSTHSRVAMNIICDSFDELCPEGAKKLRLCLPGGEIVSQYVNVLKSHGYEIEKIITTDGANTTDIEVVEAKTPKAAVKTALDGLDNETVLVISGTSAFAKKLRYSLLDILGY